MSPVRRATLAYVVYFTAVGASWPYLPVYYRALGFDLAAVGLLTGAFAATQLVAAPIWGSLTDRLARTRLTLPAAAIVAAFGAAALAFPGGAAWTVAAVVVLASGVAGVGPLLDARSLDFLGQRRAWYGQLRAWGSLAFVVTAALVGLLIDRFGTPSLFAVYVPALLGTALITLTLPRRPASSHRSFLVGLRQFGNAPRMRLFLAGSLLLWTSINAVNGFYSIEITALGAPAAAVGGAWAIGALVEIPFMARYPHLASRFGAGPLLVAGAALYAVRAAAAAATSDPTMLVLIAPLEGAGFALSFVGGVTFVSGGSPPGVAATAQGIYAAISGLGSILGVTLGGLVASALTIPALFGLGAALACVAGVVVAVAVRPIAAQTAPDAVQ